MKQLFLGLGYFMLLNFGCTAAPTRSGDIHPRTVKNVGQASQIPKGQGMEPESSKNIPADPEPKVEEPANSGQVIPDPVKPIEPMPPDETKNSLLVVSGGSEKIDVYKFDKSTGTARLLKSNDTRGAFVTFLAVHPETKRVFGTDEKGSQVILYELDTNSGALTELDRLPVAGGPAHVSVDAMGSRVYVANYGAGIVESFSVSGPELKAVAKKNAGNKAHAAHLDASGKNLFVPCLGDGLIAHFKTDSKGDLIEAQPSSLKVGSKGPRHMAFHPNGRFAYIMNEYEGSVQALSYDGSKLALLGPQIPSTASPVGGNTGAEIQVHPNGKFLYSSNRGDDSIAIYSLSDSGAVTLKKTIKTGGKTPRHFALDSSGSWMTVAYQSSGQVTLFRVSGSSGDLMPETKTLSFVSPQYAEIFDFSE
jgi:6-phosphogluconolactonase